MYFRRAFVSFFSRSKSVLSLGESHLPNTSIPSRFTFFPTTFAGMGFEAMIWSLLWLIARPIPPKIGSSSFSIWTFWATEFANKRISSANKRAVTFCFSLSLSPFPSLRHRSWSGASLWDKVRVNNGPLSGAPCFTPLFCSMSGVCRLWSMIRRLPPINSLPNANAAFTFEQSSPKQSKTQWCEIESKARETSIL